MGEGSDYNEGFKWSLVGFHRKREGEKAGSKATMSLFLGPFLHGLAT
jgi:hypothetical protein